MDDLHREFILIALAQLVVLCFWWPLIKRDRSLPEHVTRGIPEIAGGLCFLLIGAEAFLLVITGLEEPVVLWVSPVLAIHIVALLLLFRRPRLLLPWSLSVLALVPIVLVVELVIVESHTESPTSKMATAFYALMEGAALGPVFGSVVALPIAWLIVRKAPVQPRIRLGPR